MRRLEAASTIDGDTSVRGPAMGRIGARGLISCVVLASLATLLNAPKPLHIDDAAYYSYANQLAEHPSDPYGFRVYWGADAPGPTPANHVLAPPLLPYWWSLAIRLFGESPLAWKLWLLPFNLLFAVSLYALFREFARGLEAPLTWMTVLSPAFLPGVNLMLDVPAQALGLASLVLFLRACGRDSMSLATLAGLVAALAAQTKYTGLLAPAAQLLLALALGKVRLWSASALAAATAFAAWEGYVAARYGDSHFLYHLIHKPNYYQKIDLLKPLLWNLGGVAGPLAVLGAGACGAGRRPLAALAAFLLAGYALLVLGPEHGAFARLFIPKKVFMAAGALLLATAGASALRLARPARGIPFFPPRGRGRRLSWFLAMWLVLELVGYFALSPFAGVRRIMGPIVAATALIGRLAAYRSRHRGPALPIAGVAAASILLGLAFYAVDYLDARAERAVVEGAARFSPPGHPGDTWFVGFWGIQYYAERAGMLPVIPGVSQLRRGDRLVVPGLPVHQQPILLDPEKLLPLGTVAERDPIPLRTVPGYYGDSDPIFMKRSSGPRLTARVFRVTSDFVPVRP
jgi:hypothetical protein